MREVAGLGYDEIAAACGLTPDAVRSRIHRARCSCAIGSRADCRRRHRPCAGPAHRRSDPSGTCLGQRRGSERLHRLPNRNRRGHRGRRRACSRGWGPASNKENANMTDTRRHFSVPRRRTFRCRGARRGAERSGGANLLIDLVALRHIVQPDEPAATAAAGTFRSLWRPLLATAAMLVALAGGYVIGDRRSAVETSEPPAPTRVVQETAWQVLPTGGGR